MPPQACLLNYALITWPSTARSLDVSIGCPCGTDELSSRRMPTTRDGVPPKTSRLMQWRQMQRQCACCPCPGNCLMVRACNVFWKIFGKDAQSNPTTAYKYELDREPPK